MNSRSSEPSKPPVTLITGYRGLAENFIRRFSTAGHRLSVLVRREEAMAPLRKAHPQVHFQAGDVALEADGRLWVERALHDFGQIDCLINNAAIQGPGGLIHQIPFREFAETIQINLLGPVSLMQQLIPHFLERQSGVVINLSGGGGTGPRPRFTPYATSKCALVRLTETLAHEYPALHFYALSPGGLKTAMTEAVVKMGKESVGVAEYDEARRRKEQGGEDPNRAAELALWLFEERPPHLNGRLISAIRDNYRHAERAKTNPEWWTLRRVDEMLTPTFKEPNV